MCTLDEHNRKSRNSLMRGYMYTFVTVTDTNRAPAKDFSLHSKHFVIHEFPYASMSELPRKDLEVTVRCRGSKNSKLDGVFFREFILE